MWRVLALAFALAACAAEAPPEVIEAGRLGRARLFRPAPPPRALVFLFSGSGGFGADLDTAARELARGGTAVVGVDLRDYLRGLVASADGCHYVIAELEALAQRLERELGFEGYRSPILAGVGEGGTLAYAALAQAPAATIGGAVAVDADPVLRTRVPLCAGAASSAAAGGGFSYAPREDLPAPFRAVADGPLGAAVAPLLGPEAPRGEASLANLPLVELPAEKPAELFAVIFSGDGGWRDLDKTVGGILASRGVPVVGVDSLRYFWKARTPEDVARDLAAILAAYRARWRTPDVVLIGYSFGAGILPFAYNRLPEAERAHVVQLSLLGLESTAPFEFHVTGWFGGSGADDRPVLPELERIDPALVQCFYGEEEPTTLCRAPELAASELLHTRGGHHFDGDYGALAGKILAGAERRRAARAGAQRAITPDTPPEMSAATSLSTKSTARPPGAAR